MTDNIVFKEKKNVPSDNKYLTLINKDYSEKDNKEEKDIGDCA